MNSGIWAFVYRPCCSDAQLWVYRTCVETDAAPKSQSGATPRPVDFLLGLMFARTNGSRHLQVSNPAARRNKILLAYYTTRGGSPRTLPSELCYLSQSDNWGVVGESWGNPSSTMSPSGSTCRDPTEGPAANHDQQNLCFIIHRQLRNPLDTDDLQR